MNGATVADIIKGQMDATGEIIATVYSKVSATYAVYGTSQRVMVQFADDTNLGIQQRLALSPLNPLRGEINGLIDSWRDGNSLNSAGKILRRQLFDRRTADALTVALQGDQAHAAELLTAVKSDILEERTSIGRTEYMIVASVISIFVVVFGYAYATREIWLAISIGSMGALFSIALAIRSREIRTDLRRRDNIVDATLRIAIGAISAVILFSLLKGGFATIGFGDKPIDLKNIDAMVIVAFLAGFAERMVGNFLGTAILAGGSSSVSETLAARGAVQADAGNKVEANEQNPLGKPVSAINLRPAEGIPQDIDDHNHVDSCLCDTQLDESEFTDDTELPEASGGIEKAAA